VWDYRDEWVEVIAFERFLRNVNNKSDDKKIVKKILRTILICFRASILLDFISKISPKIFVLRMSALSSKTFIFKIEFSSLKTSK
jgi:hypothetical protein